MERSRFCQGWRGGLRHPKGLALTGSAARRRLPQPGRKDALYLTRRGLAAFRRGGVCGGSCPCIRPSNGLAASQSRNGSPAWRPVGLATLHPLRCADMQAIAALTAAWGERVCELAPHLTTSLGEMAAKLSVASLRAELSVGARGGRKARSACRQCTPRANLELSPGTSRRLAPACAVPATDPHQRASGPRAASAESLLQGQPPQPGEPPRPPAAGCADRAAAWQASGARRGARARGRRIMPFVFPSRPLRSVYPTGI